MKNYILLLLSCFLIQSLGFAQTKENIDTLQIPELPQSIPAIHELFSFVYKENDSLQNKIRVLGKIESDLREEKSTQEKKYDELEKKYNNFPDKKTMELRINQLVENENKLNENIATISAELIELKNNQPSLELSQLNRGKDVVIMELEGFFKNKTVDEIISSMSFTTCNFYKTIIGAKASVNTKGMLNILHTYYSAEEKLKNKCSEEDFVKIELELKGLNVDSQNVKDLLSVLSDRKSMIEDLILRLQEIQVINTSQSANNANTAKIKRSKLYERLEFFSYNHDYLNEKWPYLNNYLREVRKRISEIENNNYNVDVSDIILEFKN